MAPGMQRGRREIPDFVVSPPLLSPSVICLPGALPRARRRTIPPSGPRRSAPSSRTVPGCSSPPEQRAELLGLEPGGAGALDPGFPRPRSDPGRRRPTSCARGSPAASGWPTDQFLSPRDVRAQLLFLNGMPDDRLMVDCGAVFKPLEIWTYRRGDRPGRQAAGGAGCSSTRPGKGEPYRLWLPSDSKRALYTPQMEYWLEQWEELHGRILRRALRPPELQGGEDGRRGHRRSRTHRRPRRARDGPAQGRLARSWRRPSELAGWAREAAATELPAAARRR